MIVGRLEEGCTIRQANTSAVHMRDFGMPHRDLRVLFVCSRWDYGDKTRGPSYERTNMYDSLVHMDGIQASSFDSVATFLRGGQDAVRSELAAAVDAVRPDVILSVIFRDELPKDLLAELRDRPTPVTVNWFTDDHWQFDLKTKHYAPMFNFSTTTAQSALERYRAIGYSNVIKTQWACNPNIYRPTGKPPRFDATFVGQTYGSRPWTIGRMRKGGIDVRTWGHGWPDGMLTTDEMVAVFAESRISLNLTNAYATPRVPTIAKRVVNRLYPPALERLPGGGVNQIKGRTFEIPACGGFQLSGQCDDIESYLEPGREIVLYRSPRELVDLAHRYLRDEDSRRKIANAGYRRVLAEHTWEHRFREIFSAIGAD